MHTAERAFTAKLTPAVPARLKGEQTDRAEVPLIVPEEATRAVAVVRYNLHVLPAARACP
jgi:hypothetical protein